jgi:hypothetical protein
VVAANSIAPRHPNYAQVREYLGEAYVIQAILISPGSNCRCGSNSCDEYDALERTLVYAHEL